MVSCRMSTLAFLPAVCRAVVPHSHVGRGQPQFHNSTIPQSHNHTIREFPNAESKVRVDDDGRRDARGVAQAAQVAQAARRNARLGRRHRACAPGAGAGPRALAEERPRTFCARRVASGISPITPPTPAWLRLKAAPPTCLSLSSSSSNSLSAATSPHRQPSSHPSAIHPRPS
jgi:hypothetical protein